MIIKNEGILYTAITRARHFKQLHIAPCTTGDGRIRGHIYKITSHTGREFIGQTTRADIQDRMNQHARDYKIKTGTKERTSWLYKAMRKAGKRLQEWKFEVVKFGVICASLDDLSQIEADWIRKTHSRYPWGLNQRMPRGYEGLL